LILHLTNPVAQFVRAVGEDGGKLQLANVAAPFHRPTMDIVTKQAK